MPIENEVKFLLLPQAFEAEEIAAIPCQDIAQHYIGSGTRVRRIVQENGTVETVFTFKRRTAEGRVEIEVPISERDYDLLVATAESEIVKRRRSLEVGDHHWDIDLISTANGDFVLAEVEMPEGRDYPDPDAIPDLVGDNLVEFLGGSDAFSNEALCRSGMLMDIADRVAGFAESTQTVIVGPDISASARS